MTVGVMAVGEVARLFGVDRKTIARWCDEGKLASFRTPGGHRRFRREDVEELLAGLYQPAWAAPFDPDATYVEHHDRLHAIFGGSEPDTP